MAKTDKTSADNTDPQLKKFAEDLKRIYQSEKKKRGDIVKINHQIKKYAEALNTTIKDLKDANRRLEAQVVLEQREKLFQQKMIQMNRMTSLGTMASGIAHEINNPINFILANTQILQEVWTEIEPVLVEYGKVHASARFAGLNFDDMMAAVPRMLADNISGIHRLIRIIDDLKGYGVGRSDIKPLDINQAVHFALKILKKHIAARTSSLTLNLAPVLPRIVGRLEQIEQVLINLLQNALQALPDPSAAITVTTAFDEARRRVTVTVKDEGVGIDPEIIPRITDPFMTTRKAQGGTGLGLYVSYLIVTDHGGDMTFSSRPGQGTEVVLDFPVSEVER